MAFYNLTQLGPQNHFRNALSKTKSPTPAEDAETTETTSSEVAATPTRATTSGTAMTSTNSRPQTMSHTVEMYGSEGSTEEPCPEPIYRNSYEKYMEMRFKHQRNPQGPNDLFCYPLTRSQDYGWWMKHGNPQKEMWARTHRHAHVNSEMTRYVPCYTRKSPYSLRTTWVVHLREVLFIVYIKIVLC